jgi:hypothetical protein
MQFSGVREVKNSPPTNKNTSHGNLYLAQSQRWRT